MSDDLSEPNLASAVLLSGGESLVQGFSVLDPEFSEIFVHESVCDDHGSRVHDFAHVQESLVALSIGIKSGTGSSEKSGNAQIYDYAENRVLATTPTTKGPVYASDIFSRRSVLVLSASCEFPNSVSCWDVRDGGFGRTEICSLAGHERVVFRVRCREDVWPDRVLSGSWDKTAQVWDLARAESIGVLAKHTFWCRGVDVSSDGSMIATGSNKLRIWDAKTFAEVHNHNGEVCRLSFPRGQPHLVVAGGHCSLRCLDLRKMNPPLFHLHSSQGIIRGYIHGLTEIDRNRFAVRSDNNLCQVFNFAGKSLHRFSAMDTKGFQSGFRCVFPDDDLEMSRSDLEERIGFVVDRILSVVVLQICFSNGHLLVFLRCFTTQ